MRYTYGMPSRGAILLPMIVMISAILLTIGLAGLTVGVALSRANASVRLAARAIFGAQAGIDDAKRRIIRNPQWAPSCASLVSGSYSLALGTAAVTVCVSKSGDRYSVQSLGNAQGTRRRIDATLETDPLTGKMRAVSSYEVQF